ncbi:hypothetical protein BpHYR1_034353 [Brachionus plicatilis]|uniref:Snake toxin/toxin-like domain-containing protein n=1 Tax=Brachionus plicatilis TaxID=10195 RepID=A0A3M7PIG9_BRAPC|nr:hypothetical protein BpHYR1_034353 [Brachionus plicatilis]
MKYLVILSISAVILSCFVSQTDALQCYVCSACSGTNIGTLTNCTSGADTYCMNAFVSLLGATTVTKSCALTCTATNTGSLFGSGGGTTCCQTDGCNSSNVSVQTKAGFLILAFTAFITLFL